MLVDGQTLENSVPKESSSISSVGGFPAKTFLWLETVKDSKATEVDYGTNMKELLENPSQAGSLSKMFQGYFLQVKEKILGLSLKRWKTSGIKVSDGECWTRNISEYLNDAEDVSLSQVLEKEVPRKYWVSAKAATRILRSADLKGKEIPLPTREALENMIEIQK